MGKIPDFTLEIQIGGRVAGIDEAGRGPWAGPVVAAAALLPHDGLPDGINDSKALTREKRERLYAALHALQDQGRCVLGVGVQTPEEIDRHNILEATKRAMRLAFDALQACLPEPIAHALVDGNRLPALPCPATAVIGGDGTSLSIAAASIVAKVTRDRLMTELAREYPGYGWERNAGYGTREHQDALRRLGVTPHHRRSYAPIRALLMEEVADAV